MQEDQDGAIAEVLAADWSIIQIMRDGSQWCALYGPDLMVGVGGFGDDPIDALVDLLATISRTKRFLGRSPFLDFAFATVRDRSPASIGGE